MKNFNKSDIFGINNKKIKNVLKYKNDFTGIKF